jgi:hypothetical protein
MSTKQFRSDIHAEILAWKAIAFPTLPLVFENGPAPDEDKIGPTFLDVEIRWYSARMLAIGQVTGGRHRGAISACAYTRDHEGTGDTDAVLDSLQDYLRTRRIGTGIVEFPARTVPKPILGWYSTGLLFPFSLDV